MGQVLDLMSGQAQFNEALLSFIGCVPRGLDGLRDGETQPIAAEDGGALAATEAYYNPIDYCFT